MVNYAQLRNEYRQKHLLMGIPFVDNAPKKKNNIGWVIGALVVLLIGGCIASRPAHAYTDEQIVNAIYKAEGGKNAHYPYGIRSVKCSGEAECHRICRKTVQHYRQKYGKQRNIGGDKAFIEYVGRHYCPTVGNLSRAERTVNGFWIKNVMYFLAREVA